MVNPGEGEISLYLQTLDKFLRYDPAVIYPGQGPVVKEPRVKINTLILHRKEREQQIVALLEQTPGSVEQLAATLYTGLREGLQHLARNQVKSHLIKLEKEGKAVCKGDIYRLS